MASRCFAPKQVISDADGKPEPIRSFYKAGCGWLLQAGVCGQNRCERLSRGLTNYEGRQGRNPCPRPRGPRDVQGFLCCLAAVVRHVDRMSILVELLVPLAATDPRFSFARTTKRRVRPTVEPLQPRSRLHGWTLAQALGFGPGQRLPLRLHQRKLRPGFAHSQDRNASHRVNQNHTLRRP
jgi:hypothetical protein